jgi:hypothetical protein
MPSARDRFLYDLSPAIEVYVVFKYLAALLLTCYSLSAWLFRSIELFLSFCLEIFAGVFLRLGLQGGGIALLYHVVPLGSKASVAVISLRVGAQLLLPKWERSYTVETLTNSKPHSNGHVLSGTCYGSRCPLKTDTINTVLHKSPNHSLADRT